MGILSSFFNVNATLVGATELQLKLSGLASGFGSKTLMNEIGAYLKLQILKRTASGKDVDSASFSPYSVWQAKKRRKAGLPTSKVDLFFTGSMLSSVTNTADKTKAELFFLSTSDRYGMSNPLKAYYNQQLRNFFGISAKDVKKIESMATKEIDNYLRGKGVRP